ncbi:hypothetical protein MJO28_007969 [Puccinia striiformis f. sp. tritici]|uniref:Uncharacterized protein n=1 Tax=Puccinia striiformis f. sp. tritici TaxID=168172 RepID=A0ACC0EAQ3_9BASI|nr:hypothetical protein Pst134EB_017033 [Puccinia striiformis f. sp. tritici]KAI7949148.1 hypothetical protein MJO28_007969 [Puccinia striiformis f. sp. tritici]KAI7952271.1 hypothetical protein MJO29_007902 [Puccinia striiformis f. sp. tritici]
MIGLALRKDGHILSFLACTSQGFHLINGLPMHPPPASVHSPNLWKSANDVGHAAVPEGFSIVQTAQPGLYPVLRHSLVPVAYADHWAYEYEPVTLITNHLVPQPQQAPPQIGATSGLRPNPVQSEHAQPKTRGLPKKNTYKETGDARVRNVPSQQGIPQVAKAPSPLANDKNPAIESLAASNVDEHTGMIPGAVTTPPKNLDRIGSDKKGNPRAGTNVSKKSEEANSFRISSRPGIIYDETQDQHAPGLVQLGNNLDSAKHVETKKATTSYHLQKFDSNEVSPPTHRISVDTCTPDTPKLSTSGVPGNPDKTSPVHIDNPDGGSPSAEITLTGPVADVTCQARTSHDLQKPETAIDEKELSERRRGGPVSTEAVHLELDNQPRQPENTLRTKMSGESTKTRRGGSIPLPDQTAGSSPPDSAKLTSEKDLGLPTNDPGKASKSSLSAPETEIHLATPVKSYRSALLKSVATPITNMRPVGLEKQVKQTKPSSPAPATKAQDPRPSNKLVNRFLDAKDPGKYRSASTFEPSKLPTADQNFVTTASKDQRAIVRKTLQEEQNNSGPGQIGNSVAGKTSKKEKGQLTKAINVGEKNKEEWPGYEATKGRWEVLNSGPDSQPDLALHREELSKDETIDNEITDKEVNDHRPLGAADHQSLSKSVGQEKLSQNESESVKEARTAENQVNNPQKISSKIKNKKKKQTKNKPNKSPTNMISVDWEVITTPEENEKKATANPRNTLPEDGQKKRIPEDGQEKKLPDDHQEKTRYKGDEGIRMRVVSQADLAYLPPGERLTRQSDAQTETDVVVYKRLYVALHPGSDIKEDEIFPGIKRPRSDPIEEKYYEENPATVTGDKPAKSVEGGTSEAAEHNLVLKDRALEKRLKSWKGEWVKTWKDYKLNLNLMDSLSRHLKVKDNTKYLPLDDLNLDTYKVIRDICCQDQMRFMRGQFWVAKTLGPEESQRRLKTLIAQVSELTVLENWKVIKEQLINRKLLTKGEVQKIETVYNLSRQFPNPINCLPGKSIKLAGKDKSGILEDIEKSLGIVNSMRPNPIELYEFSQSSEIWKSQRELYSSSRYNGFDLRSLLDMARIFRDQPQIFGLEPLMDFINEGSWVPFPWHSSAERNWLVKKIKDAN